MRRFAPIALLLGAGTLPAQSFWDSSVRLAPTFQSYEVKAPFNEKVSQFSVPLFATVPVLPQLTIDVGTAFATATLERDPDIGDDALREVLSSNLCRCTGYKNILKAVRAAAAELRARK